MRNRDKDGLADLKVFRRVDDLISILNMLDRGTVIAGNFTESITRADDVSLTGLGEIVGEMNRCRDFWLIVGGLGDGVDGYLSFFGECANLAV